MKHTRRIVTMILVLAMVLAMAISASAAGNDGSITINKALAGETYKIYKVFDLTYSDEKVSYTYTKTGDADALYAALIDTGSPFTLTASTTANVYNVSTTSEADDIATFLTDNISYLGAGIEKEADSSGVKFENLAYGYYYVTSTTGSVVSIDSAKKDVSIDEKNTVPSIDKKQSNTTSNYDNAALDLNIGDTVYYQIEITDGNGTNKAITVTDVLTAGLKLNTSSIVIKKGDANVAEDNYTLNATEAGFTLVLKENYVNTLGKDETVIVTYTATVDTDAAINSATNTNTATMTYSAQTQTDTAVTVSTYDFVVKKTDGTNFLDGAEFKLYDAATGGNQILLKSDTTGYYPDADGNAITTIDINSEDGVNVRGLKPGTYYLEEVVTPAGYNTLATRQSVEIKTAATVAVEVTVVNETGSLLPSTGGMGTTIFYILGGILAVGALVVLVTNKRMRSTN